MHRSGGRGCPVTRGAQHAERERRRRKLAVQGAPRRGLAACAGHFLLQYTYKQPNGGHGACWKRLPPAYGRRAVGSRPTTVNTDEPGKRQARLGRWQDFCLVSGASGCLVTCSKLRPQSVMLRSYHHENTRSHQNSAVKRGWARLVLG